MPVTAPTDRRFRRAQLKPVRRRSRWRFWRWRALVAVAVLGIAAFAVDRGATGVGKLEMFHVDRIVVRGNQRLSTGEVLALLEGLRGQSLFSVDLEEWRLSVLNSPWVSDAVLRKTLPATVDVTIQERAPLGIGRIRGALYLVDDRGSVIDEYGPTYGDVDLPIIDGLSFGPGAETADAHRAMLAKRLLDSLRGRHMAGRISQIDVSDARNAVVLLEGDPTQIRLGHERFVERLQSYFELAPALREQVPAIDYVDLRFDERVYVRPAKEAKGPSAGAKASPVKGGRATQSG